MMHLKGIQGKHKVIITWVLMMQCNAMRLKKRHDWQSFTEQTQQISS